MALCFLVKITMRGQARIVQQQHAHGDARAPRRIGIGFCSRGQFGNVTYDGRVQVEFAACCTSIMTAVVVTMGLVSEATS